MFDDRREHSKFVDGNDEKIRHIARHSEVELAATQHELDSERQATFVV